MKEKSPAFQWYPKQFMADDKVLAMDWDAVGMHVWLINISWQQEPPGTVPDDAALIRRWLRSPSDEIWRRVWPQLSAAWPIAEGVRRANAGTIRAAERQRAFSESRSKAAVSKWNAYAVRKPCESTEDEVEVLLTSNEIKEPKTIKEVVAEFDFQQFAELIYADYPRKVGRGTALKAIESAIRKLSKRNKCADFEAAKFIHDKVLEYAKSQAGNSGKFTPHCSTWMNSLRFEDDTKEWNRDDRQDNSTEEAKRILGLAD